MATETYEPFRVVPAGAIQIPLGFSLRATVFNSQANTIVQVSYLILQPNGCVVAQRFTVQPTSDRVISSGLAALGDGWIVALQAIASAGTPRRGQCFVRVQLVQGNDTQSDAYATVLQGYVTATEGLALPGGAVESSTYGPGVMRTIVGTDPAANVEISETVPTNARWRLVTFCYAFVTDATVANRLPVLTIDDGTNVLWRSFSNVNQAASQTSIYHAGDGLISHQIATQTHVLALPTHLILMGGYRVRTQTTALQAGDNFSAPTYHVEEWIED
jgi:hypothetical protein